MNSLEHASASDLVYAALESSSDALRALELACVAAASEAGSEELGVHAAKATRALRDAIEELRVAAGENSLAPGFVLGGAPRPSTRRAGQPDAQTKPRRTA